MKLSNFKNISVALVALVTIVACNPLNKMEKNAETATYEAAPNPLEMHGDSVTVVISGKIPTKYLAKKAAIQVTPVFEADGQVIKSLDPFVLVGEDSDQEGKKIKFEEGGSFSFDYTYAYDDKMERGVLKANLTGLFKTKTKEIGSFDIAEGTNITPKLVQSDEKPILGKDAFQRIVPFTETAEILYTIQSSSVRSSELNKDEVKSLLANIKTNSKDTSIVFKGLSVESYASPDGELTKNESLADNRAKSASAVVKRQLNRYKVEGTKEDAFYSLTGKGEDWDGFKQKMQASDIEDKQLIIRVLEMYSDPAKRETEIKNLSETYVEVKEKVLPPLRRSQMVLSMERVGRSDEQIVAQYAADASVLTVEEVLYAATLTNDLNEKLSIYTKASELFASDWRTFNNMGYILLLQNKLGDAEANFNKAKAIEATSEVMNNIGVIAHLKGDRVAAKAAYAKANGAGDEVNYNMGILDIQSGDYSSAVSNMGSFKTLNMALAQILNGDAQGALATIDASEDATSAEAYYLKAIVGARTSNNDLMMKNLKLAINKDNSLKAKALKDVEFIKADLSGL
ncbi:MAG: tetratricopeptide repeat protein [Salibacteraceae bacterium]